MIRIYMGVIVPFSILLPIFFALLKWKKLQPEAKILLWYLIMSAIINFSATIIGKFYHANNMPLVHILTVLEVVILLMFYNKGLAGSIKLFWIKIIGIVFILLCICNAFFFQSIYIYCSYTRSIAAIIIMLFAINYFAKTFAESIDNKSYLSPNFYFNVAIFLYYSGAFMLFIFSNFTLVDTQSNDNFLIIWTLHATLILIMYLIFSIGFILCKK